MSSNSSASLRRKQHIPRLSCSFQSSPDSFDVSHCLIASAGGLCRGCRQANNQPTTTSKLVFIFRISFVDHIFSADMRDFGETALHQIFSADKRDFICTPDFSGQHQGFQLYNEYSSHCTKSVEDSSCPRFAFCSSRELHNHDVCTKAPCGGFAWL